MREEGPVLEGLTRRLAECPPDFLLEPQIGRQGVVCTAAVAADLLRDLGAPPDPSVLPAFEASGSAEVERNRLQLVLVACWLLYDPWFRERRRDGREASRFLREDLAELAPLVKAARLVSDPDRREELARLCLKALGLRPAGETVEQAQDRLTTISTLERQRVIRASRAAEERMRQIREAMKKKAAEEAAAKLRRE
jgi:hypothetical protein